MCQHVSIEARRDRDKRVEVGGSGRATRGLEGGWQAGRQARGANRTRVHEEGIDPAGLFSKVASPSTHPF